ncbi:hypothetical protein TRAPUB_11101 [Trametes pubescens]|uniref:Uncharacterized protein n=1 Tax=Trametes pubescens TaxID=154538 RepID=A0A1M2VXQ5_TRAPU|nr:hypothetical protein TRAPUB_11101 [Trametes pubescens]
MDLSQPTQNSPGSMAEVFPQSDPKAASTDSVPGTGRDCQIRTGKVFKKETEPSMVKEEGGMFTD